MPWSFVRALVAGVTVGMLIPSVETLAADRPDVRVAAAEAMRQIGYDPEAIPVLAAALRHEASRIRLRALNVLDRLGERAHPALREIRAATIPSSPPYGERDHPSDDLNRMIEYVPPTIDAPKPDPRRDSVR